MERCALRFAGVFLICQFFCVLLQGNVYAQVIEEWAVTFNGAQNSGDFGKKVVVDAYGNVYVTGISEHAATASDYDYLTVKYNTFGEEQWTACYNGTGWDYDEPIALAVDDARNVYVTGTSDGDPYLSVNFNYTTVKYDPEGAEEWVAVYDNLAQRSDYVLDLEIDFEGNVLVTGYSDIDTSPTDFDAVTIKYDTDGNEQWINQFNGGVNSIDIGWAITSDDQGCVYVAGESDGECVVLKYNSDGEEQWIAWQGAGISAGSFRDVSIDSEGNIVAAGMASAPGGYDYVTAKCDSDGQELWVAYYDGPGHGGDWAFSLVLDEEDNIIIAGYSDADSSFYEENYDYATVKYSPSGAQLWVQRYNGSADDWDFAYSIAIDDSGNTYVTGESFQEGEPSLDCVTIKYDPWGNELWQVAYNSGPGAFDGAHDVAVDNNGNVYITGHCAGSTSNADYITVKYSQPTSVKEDLYQEWTSIDFTIFPAYPNPFNPTTTIAYSLPEAADVTLSIFDVHGRLVDVLVNGHRESGRHEVMFDASGIPSGIYFYQLSARDFESTDKMVLMK